MVREVYEPSKPTRQALEKRLSTEINPEKSQILELAGKDFKDRVYLHSKM